VWRHHLTSLFAPDVDPHAQSTPAEPAAARPDLPRTERTIASRVGIGTGIAVLAVLAVFYTLYFARDFLVPLVIAVLLDFLLSPAVRALARWRVRPPLGTAIVLLVLIGGVSLAASRLAEPIQDWSTRAPSAVATAQAKVRSLLRPLERVRHTAEQVENATTVTGGAAAPTVVVRGPSLLERAFGTTQRFVVAALEVLILLYFLLAAGDLFLQKLVRVLPQLEDKRTAVQIARAIELSVSRYLITTAALNAGEGIVVAGALYLWGLPNPALWGVLIAFLEFIPYVGSTLFMLVLALVSLTTFDSVSHALLIPGTFLGINLLWGNLVNPALMGRQLSLNSVAVFVGLSFWFWVWGAVGAFLAVPLLAVFKIFCDHIESLASLGEFLGQREEDERRTMVRSDEVVEAAASEVASP
jgi:predicted PurR-regulated permease PerM